LKYYSAQEAAQYTGYGHTTITKAVRDGRIKAKKVGRKLLIPQVECDRLKAEREIPKKMRRRGYIGIKEAAEIDGRTEWCLRRYMQTGKLQAKRAGGLWWTRPEWLEQLPPSTGSVKMEPFKFPKHLRGPLLRFIASIRREQEAKRRTELGWELGEWRCPEEQVATSKRST